MLLAMLMAVAAHWLLSLLLLSLLLISLLLLLLLLLFSSDFAPSLLLLLHLLLAAFAPSDPACAASTRLGSGEWMLAGKTSVVSRRTSGIR